MLRSMKPGIESGFGGGEERLQLISTSPLILYRAAKDTIQDISEISPRNTLDTFQIAMVEL
jgi:hypothetical protein